MRVVFNAASLEAGMSSSVRRAVCTLAGVSLGFGVLAGWPSAQQPGQPRLTVPDGFEVVRVAGPPLVERPIAADFDEDGRLYVAESSGSNAKVEQQLAEKPHRVLRLEDVDGDGVFDRRTVFADRMMLPEGAMWFDGSLYVSAPPSIWKLTDTDGDGVADRREEWFQGKTLTGCANDLHGPYLGPDGWIYWAKGAFAEQTYDRPGQPPLVTKAAHIFRRRPGDALVEPVLTGGMDNPVDVAFTSTGDRLLTATFLEHPQPGKRDALIHAVYGGVYGKVHGVIDAHPKTGELLGPVCHLGPAAPAGLTRATGAGFTAAGRETFYAALFNMQKVTRHELVPAGSTFTSRDADFLVADSLDFHPTDVIEDADGSLLVVDTGAWYKLCCPTSQLAKPDVPGAIYRVRKRGAPAVVDPRGRRLDWQTASPDALAARLADSRPAVWRRATEALVRSGPDRAMAALTPTIAHSASIEGRQRALWTAMRLPVAAGGAAVRSALRDPIARIQRVAVHGAGLWRDREAVPALTDLLASTDPHVRRVAAEALGRIGDARAVPALLAAAARPLDRVGEHAVTYALIEIGDAAATRPGLTAAALGTRRAALVALDQMRGDALMSTTVVPLLDARESGIRETAWWIAERHPEWGEALAGYFGARLTAVPAGDDERALLERRLAQFAATPAIQARLARVAVGDARARALVLGAMARARLKTLPQAWAAPLASLLTTGDEKTTQQALAVVRAVPPAPADAPAIEAALMAVGRDATRPVPLRLEALAALSGGLPRVDPDLFATLQKALAPGEPVALRMKAASCVERARLDDGQLLALTAAIPTAGPMELPRLLPAFDKSSDPAIGTALLDALVRAKGRSNVSPELLRPRLAAYPAQVRQRGEELLAAWRADAARQARELDSLLVRVRGGDHVRGQLLFNSPKAGCHACHTIGYKGGTIGPDLTSIGQIRSERDLLEAIVFPSASFARGFESVVVTTTAGDTVAGVLKSEGDPVVVVLVDGQERRIPRADVADMQPGAISLMPAGFGEQLSRDELADLLAFLKGTRWGA
jgi:putative membrane-bound dehydrogenase-like protein